MEGFWGILKQERYYGRRFTSKRELVQMIETYIHYYNTVSVGSSRPRFVGSNEPLFVGKPEANR